MRFPLFPVGAACFLGNPGLRKTIDWPRHRNPAVARQILLDASQPPPQFSQVAEIMIQALSPSGKAAGVEWVKSLPESPQREELLRALSVPAAP